MRVGVISNRLSRRNRRDGLVTDAAMRQHPVIRHAVFEDIAGVPEVIADFAAAGIELIVIDGGDGTVQRVLTVARGEAGFATPPRFAILPSGTTNMTARDVGLGVGLGGDRSRALARLLDAAAGGGPVREDRRSTIAVTVPGHAPVLGFFVGAGALAWATGMTRHRLESRGLGGSATVAAGIGITLARGLFGSKAAPPRSGVAMRVARDGGAAREGRRFLLLATTLERLVLGLDPFWGGDEGALRLLDIDAPPRWLLGALPALAIGRPWSWMATNGYRSGRSTSVELAVDGPVLLDGEIVDAPSGTPLRLTAGPDAVFVRPCR